MYRLSYDFLKKVAYHSEGQIQLRQGAGHCGRERMEMGWRGCRGKGQSRGRGTGTSSAAPGASGIRGGLLLKMTPGALQGIK